MDSLKYYKLKHQIYLILSRITRLNGYATDIGENIVIFRHKSLPDIDESTDCKLTIYANAYYTSDLPRIDISKKLLITILTELIELHCNIYIVGIHYIDPLSDHPYNTLSTPNTSSILDAIDTIDNYNLTDLSNVSSMPAIDRYRYQILIDAYIIKGN